MRTALDTRRSERAMVQGEYAFTAEHFRRIATLVRDASGIHLAEAKATLVYSRLAKRLRALGLRNFEEYCALVVSADGVDECRLARTVGSDEADNLPGADLQ